MDPEKDESFEDEYGAAFDDATGEAPAGEDTQPNDAEPPSGSAEGTEGDNEEGEAEGEAEGEGGTDGESGDDSADDGNAGDTETDSEAGGAEGDTPAAPTAPTYDAETLRKANELLNKQKQQAQPPAAEPPAAESPADGEGTDPADEADPYKASWEDFVPDDKKDVVDRYKREWSEVHEAEEVIRNAQLQLVQERLYSDLRRALAPVFETTQRLQVNAHLDAVRQVHPDLDTVRDDLKTWIAEQPEFVRPAYEQVAAKGSAKEVIELINFYKQSRGTATGAVPEVPASSARTQSQEQRPQKQPSAAAKKALAAAPSPRKAEVAASQNDFDAAFDEAAGLG